MSTHNPSPCETWNSVWSPSPEMVKVHRRRQRKGAEAVSWSRAEAKERAAEWAGEAAAIPAGYPRLGKRAALEINTEGKRLPGVAQHSPRPGRPGILQLTVLSPGPGPSQLHISPFRVCVRAKDFLEDLGRASLGPAEGHPAPGEETLDQVRGSVSHMEPFEARVQMKPRRREFSRWSHPRSTTKRQAGSTSLLLNIPRYRALINDPNSRHTIMSRPD
ncbi:hypothetical protein AGOR_G00146740 [Albula goreensis]|uniref:Uncharacterized protein n=1 Tax=Albula goreensis TaxID=1534307 RepID=A0A8T3D7Y3_9TELE|nr:hypothetical protein AGOR_G00146740 [Albula goreensis]